MPVLSCSLCGEEVDAGAVPDRCPGCQAPGQAVFRSNVAVVKERGAASVEDLFDLEPVERAAPPDQQEMLTIEPSEQSYRPDTAQIFTGELGAAAGRVRRPTPSQPMGILPVTTQELDEGDLLHTDTPPYPSPTPPSLPAAHGAGGRAAETDAPQADKGQSDREKGPTAERKDVGEATGKKGFRPAAGRVAYPVSRDRADETPPRSAPPPRDDPPADDSPPQRRRSAALTSQTESLASGLRARRRRRIMRLVWAALAVVVGVGIYRMIPPARTPPPRPVLAPMVDAQPLQVNVVERDAAEVDDLGVDQTEAASGDLDGTVRRRRRRDQGAAAAQTAGADAATAPAPTVDPQALYRQGLQRLLANKPNEAIVLFNRVLREVPSFSLAYRGLGLSYEKVGRTALARAAYQRYLIVQPDAADAERIRQRIGRLGAAKPPAGGTAKPDAGGTAP